MNRKIISFFEIAAAIATKKDDGRNFQLGAIAIRNDGAMVAAFNGPTDFPNRKIHAEFRLSKKIDYHSTIYVARVRHADGGFGMARPCPNCMHALKNKRVCKVYYTINDKQWGCFSFEKDTDTVFTR